MILAFIIGLVFGSFLNVVICRLNPAPQLRGGVWGILGGRSMCPNCKTILKWYDLMPILSFVFLRGHCRHCRKKISWQYPIVEILSGFIWMGVFYKVFAVPAVALAEAGNFIYYLFIFSALLVIAVYDFKWKIIPDKIVYPAIAVALVFNVFQTIHPPLIKGGLGGFFNIHGYFLTHLLAAFVAFTFFFLVFYLSKGRAMGLGDAKLGFLIGLFLGPVSVIAALMLSFIIGAFFGIILIGLGKIFPDYRKWGIKSQIAFGPFLAIGTIITFFLSDFINNFINFL